MATTADRTVLVDERRASRVALARRLAHDGAVVAVRPGGGDRHDPYELGRRTAQRPARSLLVVAPRVRGPRRCVPGPVVGASPVGVLLADCADQVTDDVLPSDRDVPWVVAAMGKDVFLDPTDAWRDRLATGGRRVVDLRADRARRTDLLDALAEGPRVVLYAGHGRARGWAGYQALRWHHFGRTAGAAGVPPDARAGSSAVGARGGDERTSDVVDDTVRACGLVVAFACDTLSRPRGTWPFGAQLVASGRARAYLAPASRVAIDRATALADVVVDLLATTRPESVGDLVVAIEHAVADLPDARIAWRRFRLLGDPTTPLG